ncbi:MAG: sulfite exporter TauE/SafE family protein, partial [Methanoregula sp.]|nr:sulfite exporter TauE/SafE family protein [Methanoregula sp.]
FALATGLPVIVISFLLVQGIGKCKGIIQKIGAVEHWMRRAVAAVFIVIGVYSIVIIYNVGMF